MITVVIESPLAGDVEGNQRYLSACLLDSLKRGEAPFASHRLYPGVLDDLKPDERALGIKAGLAIAAKLDATIVYTDLGISNGMLMGIEHAQQNGRPIFYRTLGSW